MLVFMLLVLIASCEKNPPGEILPPPTTSGEHTLGFFVNGEAWVPYDRGNHKIYELPKAKLTEEGSLKISATRIDTKMSCRHWFCIEIENRCDGVGKYSLSSIDCRSPYQTFYYGSNSDKLSETYQIDQGSSHYIEVTHLDDKHKIISGRFQFDAISGAGDSLSVRLGRFDLRYE